MQITNSKICVRHMIIAFILPYIEDKLALNLEIDTDKSEMNKILGSPEAKYQIMNLT